MRRLFVRHDRRDINCRKWGASHNDRRAICKRCGGALGYVEQRHAEQDARRHTPPVAGVEEGS